MGDREGFVENSKVAVKGIVNGIFGSFLYELILTFFASFVISVVVASKNPGATEEQLSALANNAFNSLPFALVISCLASFITVTIFCLIIKGDKIKSLCNNAINLKTLKYGALCALCIMGFSIVYNSSIMLAFNLESAGNSNQENVIELIKNNAFFAFLSVVVFAPIVEELTYRYCLFGETGKKQKWVGYLASAIVFMFMHSISSFVTYGLSKELFIEMLYLPPYLFSGLALCYVYDKSDNLGSSFIAHSLNNLISFLAIVCL